MGGIIFWTFARISFVVVDILDAELAIRTVWFIIQACLVFFLRSLHSHRVCNREVVGALRTIHTS